MKKVLFSFIGLAVLLAAGVYAYRSYLVSELRQPALAALNDPDSAQFKNERYSGPWTTHGGTLCGELNAKNKMGGYVGYKRFHVAYGDSVQIGGDVEMHTIMCDKFQDLVPWWWLRW